MRVHQFKACLKVLWSFWVKETVSGPAVCDQDSGRR